VGQWDRVRNSLSAGTFASTYLVIHDKAGSLSVLVFLFLFIDRAR
jgi:hypothetical protein